MKTQKIEKQIKYSEIYFNVEFNYTDGIIGDREHPGDPNEVDLISIKIDGVNLIDYLQEDIVDDIERKCLNSMM